LSLFQIRSRTKGFLTGRGNDDNPYVRLKAKSIDLIAQCMQHGKIE
jgi:hypothetical protein